MEKVENVDILRWAVLAGVSPTTLRRYLAGGTVQTANRRRIEAAKKRMETDECRSLR
jgi:DNA-binding LacI/PurR family transcriptional regulator